MTHFFHTHLTLFIFNRNFIYSPWNFWYPPSLLSFALHFCPIISLFTHNWFICIFLPNPPTFSVADVHILPFSFESTSKHPDSTNFSRFFFLSLIFPSTCISVTASLECINSLSSLFRFVYVPYSTALLVAFVFDLTVATIKQFDRSAITLKTFTSTNLSLESQLAHTQTVTYLLWLHQSTHTSRVRSLASCHFQSWCKHTGK